MVEERWEYAISKLTNGRVLITGGSSTFNGISETAEIFEPEANVYILMPKSALAPGESMQLTVEYNGSVTWSAKMGTVTATGLYTAPVVVGTDENGDVPYDEVTAQAPNGMKATARIALLVP